jgi:hypothetical protein
MQDMVRSCNATDHHHSWSEGKKGGQGEGHLCSGMTLESCGRSASMHMPLRSKHVVFRLVNKSFPPKLCFICSGHGDAKLVQRSHRHVGIFNLDIQIHSSDCGDRASLGSGPRQRLHIQNDNDSDKQYDYCPVSLFV